MYIYSKQREPTKKRIFQAWSSLSRSTFDKSGVTPTTSQGCRKVWKSGGRRVVTWGSKIRGGGQNLGGRTYTPPPAPPVSYTPTTCCRRSNCWRRKWNKFFFLSHFDLGFADLQCKIQNWIFQLRSSKSNRFGTNQFFIQQMKADLSSKKASFSNLRLQKMEDIRGHSQTTLTSVFFFDPTLTFSTL